MVIFEDSRCTNVMCMGHCVCNSAGDSVYYCILYNKLVIHFYAKKTKMILGWTVEWRVVGLIFVNQRMKA